MLPVSLNIIYIWKPFKIYNWFPYSTNYANLAWPWGNKSIESSLGWVWHAVTPALYWQETIMVKWLTQIAVMDGIELLWMKCYVSCLCLCYLTILSVWTTLSRTDRQCQDPPVTTAKQIHCHVNCLSLIVRSDVLADWLCGFHYRFHFMKTLNCYV